MLKNLTIYFFGSVMTRMGSIILLPIFTRNLGPDEYGTLELLNRATDVLTLCFFLNGVCLAAISFYNQADGEEGRRRVVGSVLTCGSLFVGLVGLAAFALADPLGVLIGVGDSRLVRLAFLAALADALVTLCLSLFLAREQAASYTRYSIIGFALRLGLIMILVCVLDWGVAGVLISSLVASTTLGVVLVTLEVNRSGLHFDRETASCMVWFALPFLPGGICGFLLGTGDQFFLAQCASAAQVGLYALGYKLAAMGSSFTLGPFMRFWGARMHQVAREADAPQVFGRVFTRFVGAYLLVGLGLALFGQELILVLAHPQYLGAIAFVPPVVLAYFFISASDLMDAAFYVRRRTHVKLWITLLSAAVMLILYLILIPPFKGLGAAYATLLGFVVRMGVTYLVSQRLFWVSYEWSRVGTIVVSAVGCWSLGQFVAGPLWMTVPAKTLILGLFPAILWLTGQVSPGEKQVIIEVLGRSRLALARLGIPVPPVARRPGATPQVSRNCGVPAD